MEEKNKKKIIQNKKPSDVFGETILISDNTNFSYEVSKFISKLEEKYSIYIQETKEIEIKWEEFNSNNEDKDSNKIKNVYIESERMSIKSPTTILNAPWGTGKTHFIEEIALNWNNDDIKESRQIFKNFIVVDTWRFLTSPNVLNSLILEIYNVLYKTLNKAETKQNSKKWWENIKKIVGYILPWTPMIFGAIGEMVNPNSGLLEVGILGSEIAKETRKSQEKDKDETTTAEDLLNEVNSLIEPTIIVFDNIERMGIHSWEIIKTIQRLSVFKNLLFLLPLNKSQLKFNNDLEHQKKNESSIDKYITLGTYFDLRQDYIGVLKTMDFEEETINLINNILNEEIDGYKLSIRLIKYSFETYKIKKSFDINKYYGLKQLKEIWNANLIYYVIETDFNELEEDFNELNRLFKNKNNFDKNTIDNISNFINYYKNFNNLELILKELNFSEIENELIKLNYNFLTNISYDWLEEWENYINRLNKFKIDLKKESNKMLKQINKNKDSILEIEKNNVGINNKINEYKEKIEKIENKPNNSSDDAINKVDFEKSLNSLEDSLEKNNNNITELNKNNEIINEALIQIKNLVNDNEKGYLDVFIQEFLTFYNQFKFKLDIILNNKDKKEMHSILIKKVDELINNDNEYYNKYNKNTVFKDEYTKDSVINELLGINE